MGALASIVAARLRRSRSRNGQSGDVQTGRAGERRGTSSGGGRPPSRGRFTLVVFLSAVALLVAWTWFAIVVEDTWGDECKARAAGQSGVGFLIVVGVVPLVVVTVGAAVALIGFAPGSRGWRVLRGVAALLVISACGLLLALWMTDWMLVAHLALGSDCLA